MRELKLDPRLEDAFWKSCGIWQDGTEIVPRYELFSKTGCLTVFFQMPDAAHLRAHGMKQIADLGAWIGASAVVVSAELMEPESVLAVLVTHRSAKGVLGITKPGQKILGELMELEGDQIPQEFRDLLPRGARTVDEDTVAGLEALFRIKDREGVEALVLTVNDEGRARADVFEFVKAPPGELI